MKKLVLLSLVVMSVVLLASFVSGNNPSRQATEKMLQDSLEADRAKYVNLVKESIKGKENMRADSVFKNIKILRVPAGKLLAIMNFGYSHSLGVSCGHCHNTSDFSSDEKKEKDIARQMVVMNNKINTELLKNIQGLESQTPVINCTTCHRGEVKPALNLETNK